MPVVAGAAVRVLVPTDANGGTALGQSWTGTDFDDSGWIAGTTGVGCERGADLRDLIATDIGSEMFGVNSTAYLRIPFTIAQPDKVFSLVLRMQYDDGYAAYVNGMEVARVNAPQNLRPTAKAETLRADADARTFAATDISPYIGLLRRGANLLAVHALNWSSNDEDLLIVPELQVRSSADIESTAGRYLPTPTPGAANGEVSFGGLTATPDVSVDGGLFAQPFDVLVSSDVPGTTLAITTDGSSPAPDNGILVPPPDPGTPASTLVHIAGTTLLRVVAFKEDFMPSPTENRTYIFPGDIVTQDDLATLNAGFPSSWGDASADYGIDPDVVGPNDLFDGKFAAQFTAALKAVPSISLIVAMDDLFGPEGLMNNPEGAGFKWERPTSVELLYPDGSTGFQVNAGLRIAGDASRRHSNAKKEVVSARISCPVRSRAAGVSLVRRGRHGSL